MSKRTQPYDNAAVGDGRTPLWRRLTGPLLVLCVAAAMYHYAGQSSRIGGTVMLGNEPVTTGVVRFHPVGSGPVAIGQIDEQGRYAMTTDGEPGLASGKYVITIADDDAAEAVIPERYSNQKTTPLHAEVRAGSQQLNFNLAE